MPSRALTPQREMILALSPFLMNSNSGLFPLLSDATQPILVAATSLLAERLSGRYRKSVETLKHQSESLSN